MGRKRIWLTAACGLMLLLTLAACRKKHPVKAIPRPVGSTEVGLASWYGHPYHGRPAADGEIYDMEKMTAAHRTLPFNTWLRVENLTNGKTCDVRITDRGPFVRGRVIDLSHAAARQIELIGPGVAKVRMVVIGAPPAPARNVFAVQVGAFQDRARAERVRDEMQREFGTARLVLRQGNPAVWRVLVGEEPTIESADALAVRIRGAAEQEGQSGRNREAFVVREDLQ